MRVQCHHIGAYFGARRFQLPAEPSSPGAPSRAFRSLEQTRATHTHGASVATPLQGRRLTPGRQPRSVPLLRLPISPFSILTASPQTRRRRSGGNLQLADFSPTTDVHEEGTEMADPQADNAASVYLYIPNIIGYMRVLMNFVAFSLCFTNKKLFVVLYFISFVFDGLDGWFARRLNQVSTLGAALDMDIASHWLQMYSTFLLGKASHKDIKDNAHWLLKAYYRNRLVMGFCCIGSEVVYITLFLLAEKQHESMFGVIVNMMKQRSIFLAPFLFAILGWATKQVVNVLQMKMAAAICVLYDMMKRS